MCRIMDGVPLKRVSASIFIGTDLNVIGSLPILIVSVIKAVWLSSVRLPTSSYVYSSRYECFPLSLKDGIRPAGHV